MRGEPIQQTLPDIVCPLCGHAAGPGTLITGGRGRQIGWHCKGCGADVTAHKSAHLSLIDTTAKAGLGRVGEIRRSVDAAVKAYGPRPTRGGRMGETNRDGTGWALALGARKFHYYREHRSLCSRVMLIVGEFDPEIGEVSPDDCAECRRRADKLKDSITEDRR